MESRKIKIRRVQLLAAVSIALIMLFVPLTALAGAPGDEDFPEIPSGGTGVTGGGPDVQIGSPGDMPPSYSGETGSAFPDQQQSLVLSPEQPLTTLPATGGAIFPALALSLLLAGSGAVIKGKFKER